MSDPNEATEALDEAIRTYAAAEQPGDYVAGWVVLVSTVLADNDGADGYLHDTPSGQSLHTTLGLLEMARIQIQRKLWEADQ